MIADVEIKKAGMRVVLILYIQSHIKYVDALKAFDQLNYH